MMVWFPGCGRFCCWQVSQWTSVKVLFVSVSVFGAERKRMNAYRKCLGSVGFGKWSNSGWCRRGLIWVGLRSPSFSLDDICPDPCLNEDSLDSEGFYRWSSSWRLFSVLFTEFLSFQKAAFPVEQQKLNGKEGLLHFGGIDKDVCMWVLGWLKAGRSGWGGGG